MRHKKESVKRYISLLLAVVMAVLLFPGQSLGLRANAEEMNPPEVTVSGETQTYIPDPDALPDSDELFAGYVERTLYGMGNVSMLGNYGKDVLSGLDLKIYEALKSKIKKVADGTESSTQFALEWEDLGIKTTWTAEELGVDSILLKNEDNSYSFNPEAVAALKEIIAFDSSTIIDCLLADCPYELYWFNKTAQMSISTNGGYSGATDYITLISGPTFYFPVSSNYAGAEAYTTDTGKTSAASTAAANAMNIVIANEDLSDYKKLVAYKQEICSLVSYNTDAATNLSTPYGDPWQLIYVFDGDTSTNVVCEGYSKAFQYLCDLSDFTDDITCYSVSGTMTTNSGGGAHMWNIVTMEDGKNYLVDVTNCDGEQGATTVTIGYPDKLFLVGTAGNVTDGYTFADVSNVHYSYDADTISLFGTGILTLAVENYVPPHEHSDASDDGICDDCGIYMDISDYRDGETYTYPTQEGCVFAGWYEDAAFETPISKDTVSGAAYAKFVDADVLSVKWQIRLSTLAEDKTDLRLITTVDSLNYQNVGFYVTFNEKVIGERTSNVVYSQLSGWESGTLQTYLPTEFSESSSRFMAYRFNNIPESDFDGSFAVTPFWTTLDGTKVTGTVKTFKISEDSNVAAG